MKALGRFGLPAGQRAGVAILLLLLALCALEALFNPATPQAQNLAHALALPSFEHPFGTDPFGRSMLARVAAATRLSLALAALSVLTSATLGVALGVVAGWRGGLIDHAACYLVTMLMALPSLVLVLMVAALAPDSLPALYFAISLVLWVEYFRVVRSVTSTIVRAQPMQASRMLGFGQFYCFRRHLWPGLRAPVWTLAAFGAGNTVLALAALGFVSVGLRPPRAELGLMMVELFPHYREAPWALAQPLLVVFLLVLSFNLIAGQEQR